MSRRTVTKPERQKPKESISLEYDASFIKLLVKNSPRDKIIYSFFGIFCFISTLGTICRTHSELSREYAKLILIFYGMMAATSIYFIFYMIWGEKLRHPKLVATIWNIAIIYMLTFCGSFFLMLSNYDNIQLALFTLSLIVLFTLCTSVVVSLIVISLGFAFSLSLYNILEIKDRANLSINYSAIVYIALMSVSVFIMFLKRKQEKKAVPKTKADDFNHKITRLYEVVTHYYDSARDRKKEIGRLGKTTQKILNKINNDLRLPIGNLTNFPEKVAEILEQFNSDRLKMISDEIDKSPNLPPAVILNILDLVASDAKKIKLKRKNINLSELVEDRINNCRKIYLSGKKITFEITVETNLFVCVDPDYMRQVVDNILLNSINNSIDGIIKVGVLRVDCDTVEITITDEGIAVPKHRIFDIFTASRLGVDEFNKAQGRSTGLILCKSTIDAHEGEISVESNGQCGATFNIKLAVK